MTARNPNHWYDGGLYRWFLDPWTRSLRAQLASWVAPGSTVLDVACGTGSFVFDLAEKCRAVTGLELAPRMVRTARRRARRRALDQVTVVEGDATALEHLFPTRRDRFEYATIILALHEMPPPMRIRVLRQMRTVAGTVLAADFHAPPPRHLFGALNTLAERMAGREHYRSSRQFLATGGLVALARHARLRVVRAAPDRTGTYQFLALR